jgi:hypothetical protein
MNPLAVALQGVGFGPLSLASQGFLGALVSELYQKYISTIYQLNPKNIIYRTIDKNVVYEIKSTVRIVV